MLRLLIRMLWRSMYYRSRSLMYCFSYGDIFSIIGN